MEKVKISAIKANSKNPRVIKDDKFKKLVKSIQDFPEMLEKRPLVCFTDIDGKYVVLGGNMRLKAAQEVGLKELPIVLADDWTQEQRDEFLIKDNVGFGEWDWDQLANEWDAGKLDEWGLDVPNFDGEVLEAEEDDFDTTLPDEPITVLGDLYEIGEHRLLCGDSTDSDQVAKLMNGQKADMVFTDPPYNIGFKGTMSSTSVNGEIVPFKTENTKYDEIKNDKHTAEQFQDFIKSVLITIVTEVKGGWYISFSSSNLHELLIPISELKIEYKSIIIWEKNQANMGGGHYKRRYEPIVYGYNENVFYGEPFKEEDVWEFQRTLKNDLHPTMKPIQLIENALNKSSKAGDIVFDLFLGSGSTMVASHQLKRKCYGMELDPKYCDVIVNRMIALDPNIEIKLNGKPFEKAH
jgi:site-specific DNA-methyltransferase (adenine-specific)